MVHPWNKICLVSAIALAGTAFFFAGCTPDNMRWIYDDLTDATTKKMACSCSYFQYGQQYFADYNDKIYTGCDGLKQALTDQYGAAAKASCWPK